MFFAIPLAGVVTALVGLIFGLPAARLKGLYLAIATLAAQYILLDFFSRAEWFTGGAVPASAQPFSIFGFTLRATGSISMSCWPIWWRATCWSPT